ncbi:MAG: hypothetical protein KDK64_03630 [Chlamydiia bacterium]|nr:hypothetical protein [Chlamydiia bacterium]
MRFALILVGLMGMLAGCYQASSNGDDDLRAVPVTNNPNLVPDRGLGPMQAMPY